MDVFLGGQFTTYGTEVWAVSEQPLENRIDPMSKVFPKVTNHFVANEAKAMMVTRWLTRFPRNY